MNPLCISNINLRSPYAVWEDSGTGECPNCLVSFHRNSLELV